MIKYTFNHVEHEKKNIECLAQTNGLMVTYGTSEYDVSTINIDKGGVILTDDPLKTNVVTLIESVTNTIYLIPVNMIVGIRIFSS